MRTRHCIRYGMAAFLLATSVNADAAGDLRLVEAAKRRDVEAVIGLLKQRVDANVPQADGTTALHWAVQAEDLHLTDLLIRAGADVNAATQYGVTPIAIAATGGHPALVDRLLKAGADPNTAFPSGETALMTAARTGRVDAVKLLLARGADINRKEHLLGQTALMWAIAERHADVARLLIESGADIRLASTAGSTPLMFAARTGDLGTGRLLLDRGADVNATMTDSPTQLGGASQAGTTALLIATVRGHAAFAEMLLERGADANAAGVGYAPLHWAVGRWFTLTTHDYPNASGEWAALAGLPDRKDKLRLINALLARGADPNARVKRMPRRFGETVSGVLQGGLLPGATPFFFATQAGDVEVMRLLVAHGADPLAVTDDGLTALMAAAGMVSSESETLVTEDESLEAARLAVQLGCPVGAANKAGNTAMHATAFVGYSKIAQFLVQQGADINPRNNAGQTPLTIAAGVESMAQVFQHLETAEVLKKLGAVK